MSDFKKKDLKNEEIEEQLDQVSGGKIVGDGYWSKHYGQSYYTPGGDGRTFSLTPKSTANKPSDSETKRGYWSNYYSNHY